MRNEPGHIVRGEVVHKRVHPRQHKLSYRVFSLLLDVDQIDDTAARLKFFSLDRFNIFSVKQKDHGFRDGSSLSKFAWNIVDKAGVSEQVASIEVLLYPRLFGFAFNPLTVYFCNDGEGQPVLLIYEVRNTFGEFLTYVLHAGRNRNGTYTHNTRKLFYVSPFNNVEGDYTFHVAKADQELTVGVALSTAANPILRTHFRGKKRQLSDASLLRCLYQYPLMTLKVVWGIHWEALKLWRKGLPLRDRPDAPQSTIVFDSAR